MSDPIELAAIDRGSGPAVVFVHGGVFHSSAWAKNIAPVADAGFRAIAIDRRGHGRSEPGNADFIPLHLHADDLRLTLELREIPAAHLVGVSYGSLVALEYALSWPGRVMSMTLVEPPLFAWLADDPDYKDWFRRFEEIATTREDMELEDWIPRWLEMMDQRMAKEIDPSSPAWKVVERQAHLVFKEEAGWQYHPDEQSLSRLSVPTLVVNGDQSEPPMQVIGSLLADRLPKAGQIFIPGAGHDPHARNHEDFNVLLIDFLERIGGPQD